jgi:hypothetical protein
MSDVAVLRSRVVMILRKWMIRHPFLVRASHLPALTSLRRLLLGKPRVPESSDARDYETFRRQRIAECEKLYPDVREPGLLCFITTVWNTAPEYLLALADSLFTQKGGLEFEWLLVDNGSTDEATRECLAKIARHPTVRFERVEKNLGIIGGMRRCLENARARYILPLDSDDMLYPQCVSIITRAIQTNGYPAVLYTDEDKLEGNLYRDAYYKPDWDPVLFVNSCYIAHLCAIDRQRALELGCYSDPRAEGSHDWDSFTRFMLAGHKPLHVTEVVYSWRMHPQSTAGNYRSKPVIYDSQLSVLERFLAGWGLSDRFEIVASPLFPGTPDWWISRKPVDPHPIVAIKLGPAEKRLAFDNSYPAASLAIYHASDVDELRTILNGMAGDPLIYLQDAHLRPEGKGWAWEGIGLFELFGDCAMVGGRILSRRRYVLRSTQYFGFGEGCGCPEEGRSETDFGYFAKMAKANSASAVSAEHCFIPKGTLIDSIDLAHCHGITDLSSLGDWCGLAIRQAGCRVIYSPHLVGIRDANHVAHESATSRAAFIRAAANVLPETVYLSPHLGLTLPTNYRPVPQEMRRTHLERLRANANLADK